jgi:MraZ protein
MATPCSVDRQGRILIPTYLREHAGIDRELVFMGVGDEIEVWDRSRHRAEILDSGSSYSEDSRDVLTRER